MLRVSVVLIALGVGCTSFQAKEDGNGRSRSSNDAGQDGNSKPADAPADATDVFPSSDSSSLDLPLPPTCVGPGPYVCAPGASQTCGNKGVQTCGAACTWGACGTQICDGQPTLSCGNCGTQTRTCDTSTGMWSAPSACTGQGACMPGASQACGAGGVQACGATCAWGACGSQMCSGSPSQACGNCGTQTRTCDTSTGMWSAFSACTNEKSCKPGASQACGSGGMQMCNSSCQWGACGGQMCSGAPSMACGNCGTATHTCNTNTGMWSAFSACMGQGACTPGASQRCGNGGTQSCGTNCQWGACVGQTCNGSPAVACGNCGTQTRTCDLNTGNWTNPSGCNGQGSCAPGATQGCANGGKQMCGGNCQWGACGNQMCPGSPNVPCGNCGTQTRTCDPNTGNWSAPSGACNGQGACAPGATQACAGGRQSCGGNCQWDPCSCNADIDCAALDCGSCYMGTCKTSNACHCVAGVTSQCCFDFDCFNSLGSCGKCTGGSCTLIPFPTCVDPSKCTNNVFGMCGPGTTPSVCCPGLFCDQSTVATVGLPTCQKI